MPRFVIQHHLATADHYDLRLEIDGVLASWAVPKGPSMDPSVRRLALQTDDHHLAHESVEGVFGPRRSGGTVLVWDRGTYRNTSHDDQNRPLDATAALARGHLSFVLAGVKVSGGFSLIRTGQSDRSWLLLKKADADADPHYDPIRAATGSVLTGRTMEQVQADEHDPVVRTSFASGSGTSIPVLTATDLASHGAEQRKDRADDDEDDSERPQDSDVSHESDDE